MPVSVTDCEGNGDVKVAKLGERLDVGTSEEAASALLDAVEQSAAGLIVDIGAVDFISSAGLRALIRVRKRADGLGKTMALVGVQPAVYKIFKVSGLDAVLRFFGNEAEALDALWPKKG